MSKGAFGRIALASFAVVLLALLALSGGNRTEASGPQTFLAIDSATGDNTSSAIGTVNPCFEVAASGSYTLDVVIGAVADAAAVQITLNYTGAVTARDVSVSLLNNAIAGGTTTIDAAASSDDPSVIPDNSGAHTVVIVNDTAVGSGGGGASGSGLLIRFTLTAPASAGTYPLLLSGDIINNSSAGEIAHHAHGGTLQVGDATPDGSCAPDYTGPQGQSVTLDSVSQGTAENAPSFSWQHTVGTGPNRLLLVSCAIRNLALPTVTMTYGGTALTLVLSTANTTVGAAVRTDTYRLLNPASGTNTITVTLSVKADAVCGASSYYNVNQTTPLGTAVGAINAVVSNAPTVNVATAVNGGLVYGALAVRGTTGTSIPTGSVPLSTCNPSETGSAAAVTALATLTDTSKSWITNQWTGATVTQTSGTGAGQSRTVLSNTATVLTLSAAWTLPAAAGYTIDLCRSPMTELYNSTSSGLAPSESGTTTAAVAALGTTLTDSTKSWVTNQWANFSVRITSGSTDTARHLITANTATGLTVSPAWAAAVSLGASYTIDDSYLRVRGAAAVRPALGVNSNISWKLASADFWAVQAVPINGAPQDVAGTYMAVDLATSDNTDTGVGTITTCLEVASGATYSMDVVVGGVLDLVAGQFTISYQGELTSQSVTVSILNREVPDVGGSALIDAAASDPAPDVSGFHTVVASNDAAIGSGGANGSGILVHFVMTAPTVGSATTFPLDLTGDTLNDHLGAAIAHVVHGAQVQVGDSSPDGSCGPDATATATDRVTLDATSQCAPGNSRYFTWPHTVAAGSNRLLIVTVAIRQSGALAQTVSNPLAPAPAGIQYAGQNLTLVSAVTNALATNSVRSEIWRLVNPPTGTANVTVTLTAAADTVCGASDWNGVNQTTPLGTAVAATGLTATPTASIATTDNNQIVVDSMAAETNIGAAAGAGQSIIYNNSVGTTLRGASSSKLDAVAPLTMSWTLGTAQRWAEVIVSIKAAPTAATSFDSAASVTVTNSTTCSWLHTVGSGNDRLLLVGVSLRNLALQTVSTSIVPKFNGVAMTLVSSATNGIAAPGNVRAEMWRLLNPPVGTFTVTVTFATALAPTVPIAANAVCGSTSWSGVNQSVPLGTAVACIGPVCATAGASTTPTATVTAVSGDVVANVLAAETSETATAGACCTERWNASVANQVRGAASNQPGPSGAATTVVASWTLGSTQPWALLAVPIKPAPIAPTYVSSASNSVTASSTCTISSFAVSGNNRLLTLGVSLQQSLALAQTVSATLPPIWTVGAYHGTATGSQSTAFLRDNSQPWGGASLAGGTITIGSGTGAGQTRTITGNSGGIISVSPAWTTAPADGLSTYVINGTQQTFTLVLGVTNATVNTARSEVWRLVNPAAGTGDVNVTLTGATPPPGTVCGVTSWKGVNQLAPLGTALSATGTSTAPSVSPTALDGQIVVDNMAANAGPAATVGTGQTSRYNATVATKVTGAGSSEPGVAPLTATAVPMTWTLDSSQAWATVGVAIAGQP